MNVALVNLISKTADLPKGRIAKNPVPTSDLDLNITQLAKCMAAKGHEVTIYIADAYEPATKCSLAGVEIVYVPTRLSSILPPAVCPCTPNLKSQLKDKGFDIVQSGEVFQLGTFYAHAATKNTPAKFFIWQELDILMQGTAGTVQKQFYRTIGKRMSKHCKLIPRSKSAADHLRTHGFAEEQLTTVVHSGVNCTTFCPLDKHEARQRFGLENADQVVIAVGRFHINKGFDILIKSAAIVRKNCPHFKLILKGTGPEEEALRLLVSKLELKETVIFHTQYLNDQEMAMLYNCADLYVLCSRNDLFPFTAIEAIACGVPIVSSFQRGIESDIINEGAGVLTAAAPEEIAATILELLADQDTLDNLRKKSRSLALNEFDFNISAERLCGIYEGAL